MTLLSMTTLAILGAALGPLGLYVFGKWTPHQVLNMSPPYDHILIAVVLIGVPNIIVGIVQSEFFLVIAGLMCLVYRKAAYGFYPAIKPRSN